ncbi:hypothetical protein AAU57_12100 [Nonlabens sp. YIK11]|uniref:hypothetical protein n=1 Tax=Nonlabens sp. YIK11 TaxID=1453349 RepID=UPI0007075C4A|nr:hypothetical protein [Nonlabens sp. YIK11]KQC33990.1 hypothetical protein AAU57_12100 [Nonlabens sp. YIK11]
MSYRPELSAVQNLELVGIKVHLTDRKGTGQRLSKDGKSLGYYSADKAMETFCGKPKESL